MKKVDAEMSDLDYLKLEPWEKEDPDIVSPAFKKKMDLKYG